MDPVPGRGTWEGFWSDLVFIHAIIAIIVLADVGVEAIKRWRSGQPLLLLNTLADRRYMLALVPFIVIVLIWEHGFGAFGFDLRDDDPYFLALLAALAALAYVAVRWSKRQP